MLILAVGLPRSIALYILPILLALIAWEGRKNIPHFAALKIVAALLLGVPLGLAINSSFPDAARLVSLVILILLFPYRGIRRNLVGHACIALFAYVFFLQIGILFGFGVLNEFRDMYYPISQNFWDEALLERGYAGFRDLRAAGIFYNPNVMAAIAFFPYAIYTATATKPFRAPLHLVFTLLVATSIVLTGSRVYLVAVIAIILFNAVRNPLIRSAAVLAILVAGAEYLAQFIFRDFTELDGSMAIKREILVTYLNDSSGSVSGLMKIIFGGVYDIQFDTDVGYILGAWGISGTLVSLGLITACCINIPGSARILLPIYATSFANSLLYSLQLGPLFVVIVISIAVTHHSVAAKHGNSIQKVS